MTPQWTRERECESRQFLDSSFFDPEEGVRRLLEACPSVARDKTFREAVEWIARDGEDLSELELRMGDVSARLELTDIPKSANLLLALACAEALAAAPSLATWERVRKLQSNSWQIENWLSGVMKVCAEGDAGKRDAFIGLAETAFKALDAFALVSQFERRNTERKQFGENWNERADKLEEIWFGRCDVDFFEYEESPLFRLLAALAPAEFIRIVSQSRNPHLVNSALVHGEAWSTFSLWKEFARSAPTAFDADGTWNGSVMIPLLLVMARGELMQATRISPRFDASEIETENARQEIPKLSSAIVEILAKRLDALPLFARWSTWLMRQRLLQCGTAANGMRTSSDVDDALIEAIGLALKGKALVPESPADAPTWEAWCYRAVLASHAHSGFIAVPGCEGFLGEWAIGFDDWADARGKRLRARADLITTLNKEIPGDAAHALAYPIAMSESPVNKWLALWDATLVLREVVEFGEEYQERGEAGRLLLLVFCMGLAILDQRVAQHPASDSVQARDLARLHEALALAVREMREIDVSLNREQWRQANRHLAVRRLIWEEKASNAGAGPNFSVFLPTDKPTFDDYLIETQNDVMELVPLLQMARRNGAADKAVREKLVAASIDLSRIVATARRLNEISARRYPMDEMQMEKVL
ncbi:MAG: hypothetical protein H3C26_13670 [Rhodocyclaceae bacterium]|nr:hypothetical protein [Rhodocyclaceae bacterium]